MPVELKIVALPSGELLRFEEDVAPPSGPYLAAIAGEAVTADFKAALGSVKSLAGEIFGALASLAQPPDGCELTLGLKLSTEAGFIVAKAQGEANIGVKLSWKFIPKPDPVKS
jgi:hypothetical protein